MEGHKTTLELIPQELVNLAWRPETLALAELAALAALKPISKELDTTGLVVLRTPVKQAEAVRTTLELCASESEVAEVLK